MTNFQKTKLTSLIGLVLLVGSSFIIPVAIADDYDSYEIVKSHHFSEQKFGFGGKEGFIIYVTSPNTHIVNFSIITRDDDPDNCYIGDFNISILDEDNYFQFINGSAFECRSTIEANNTKFSYTFIKSGLFYLEFRCVAGTNIKVNGYMLVYKKIIGTIVHESGGDLPSSNYIPGFSLLLIGIISLISISIVIWKTRSKTR